MNCGRFLTEVTQNALSLLVLGDFNIQGGNNSSETFQDVMMIMWLSCCSKKALSKYFDRTI